MWIFGQIRKSPQKKDYVSDRPCNNNGRPKEIMLKYIFKHFLCDNLRAKTRIFGLMTFSRHLRSTDIAEVYTFLHFCADQWLNLRLLLFNGEQSKPPFWPFMK